MEHVNKAIIGSLHINEIDLDYVPRKQILQKIHMPKDEPEMSEFESGFLCGVLRKFCPKVVVEIGVAAGGTTALVLNCLESIGNEYEMHSIDCTESFYKDKSKRTGYLAEEYIRQNRLESRHSFHFGGIAYNYLQEIGDKIDFVILDTVHTFPGELFDALTLLPIMKNAVVVMHDTMYNLYSDQKDGYATGALLAAVVGEKYMNFDPSRDEKIPNIAAFVMDNNTKQHIDNILLSLLPTWRYMPDELQIQAYREAIRKLYPNEATEYFEAAIILNQKKLSFAKRVKCAAKILIRGK